VAVTARGRRGHVTNKLRDVRGAAGMTGMELAERIVVEAPVYYALEKGQRYPTADELRKLADVLAVDPEHLYPGKAARILAGPKGAITYWDSAAQRWVTQQPDSGDPGYESGDASSFFALLKGPERLLVAPEEMTWYERKPDPDHPVDVFLSMSCGTQSNPNLLQDTVAVCDALGVSFVAAAGPAGCCGGPVWGKGVGPQWAHAKVGNQRKLGVRTNVNWCTNCQLRLTSDAHRRETEGDYVHPVREVQLLTFLEERVRELGDRVPWKQEVRRKVVAEGHWAWTDVHRTAQVATTRLLAMIPGIEVVGLYDGHRPESPCAYRARNMVADRAVTDPPPAPPRTTAEVRAKREQIADAVNAMGADTVACQHQGCHLLWSYWTSDRLAVMHGVSILAEALGVKHTDRFQAAARLGDPSAVLEQTRPVWTKWGIPEEEARELAEEFSDPRFGAGVTRCGCGGDECGERLISIDVLTGQQRERGATV
jgi:transcriptional regulator with XRE-family HTH domain